VPCLHDRRTQLAAGECRGQLVVLGQLEYNERNKLGWQADEAPTAERGADGSVCLYTSATSDIIVDIAGWFSGDATNGFVGSTPKRLVDTRDGTGPTPQ
jgi:hypothetical protein